MFNPINTGTVFNMYEQNHYKKVANKSFENVANFKYLGRMVTKKITFTSLRAE
jgi:hypothetical protein